MPRPADTTLLGTYTTPPDRYGDVVFRELRGEVTLVGLREAPIPWPVGKKGGTGRWCCTPAWPTP